MTRCLVSPSSCWARSFVIKWSWWLLGTSIAACLWLLLNCFRCFCCLCFVFWGGKLGTACHPAGTSIDRRLLPRGSCRCFCARGRRCGCGWASDAVAAQSEFPLTPSKSPVTCPGGRLCRIPATPRTSPPLPGTWIWVRVPAFEAAAAAAAAAIGLLSPVAAWTCAATFAASSASAVAPPKGLPTSKRPEILADRSGSGPIAGTLGAVAGSRRNGLETLAKVFLKFPLKLDGLRRI